MKKASINFAKIEPISLKVRCRNFKSTSIDRRSTNVIVGETIKKIV